MTRGPRRVKAKSTRYPLEKNGKLKGGKQLALEKGEQAEVQVKNPEYLDLVNEIKKYENAQKESEH